ncbi:hypothetical protein BBK82_22940 [Lentzea guizhouensis]|uniref:TIR domain-containing protein n=1 Tax=Lentzea guizhouensis TaxID=1586287 RepID=A0A1B2HL89_9PSEU|nr:TIR domain-containing protein [Lentzea guizhouensis]ANZ38492.1 hypothetical protein BBK82_22940 [Lentzea guizhouensis]
MPSESATNFRGALAVLGQYDTHWTDQVNRRLGNVLTTNRARKSMLGVYGWILPRSTVPQLVTDALDKATRRIPQAERPERRELVIAVQTTLLMTSLFDASREVLLGAPGLQPPADDDWHQEDHSFVSNLYSDDVPAPSASRTFDDHLADVTRWVVDRSERIHRALRRSSPGPGIDVLLAPGFPADVTDRYRRRYLVLAEGIREFVLWASIPEDDYTRMLDVLFSDELSETRAAMSNVREREIVLAANLSAFHEPPTGDASLPPLSQTYVSPRFRAIEAGPSARLTDDDWWTAEVPVRHDLDRFLESHLTSAAATRLPALVIGVSGAGKSTLAKALAAHPPSGGVAVVRVTTEEVFGRDSSLEGQVEHAVELLTDGHVRWEQLDRDLRVVVLDGLDPLAQADHLAEVVRFQQRSAAQDRPVAVVITMRTDSVKHVLVPDGTPVVRLEEFDDDQIRSWIEKWNAATANTARRPLAPESVLPHRELARAPLFLSLLAEHLTDPDLPRPSPGLSKAVLRGRVLDRHAQRMGTDTSVWLVAAMGMFNRGRTWLSESEFHADLAALGHQVRRLPPVLLHETVLDEYRIASFVLASLDDLAAATALDREPEDTELFTLLCHQLLSTRPQVLQMVTELSGELTQSHRNRSFRTLDALVKRCPRPRDVGRYAGYRPTDRSSAQAEAVYSANLMLLLLSVAPESLAYTPKPELLRLWRALGPADGQALNSAVVIGDGFINLRTALSVQAGPESPPTGVEFVHQALYSGSKAVEEVAWSADGRLLTAVSGGLLAFWEMTETGPQALEPFGWASDMAWHPDRQLAAVLQRRTRQGAIVRPHESHRIVLTGLDAAQARRLGTASQHARISWSPDGAALAVVDVDDLRILDSGTGAVLRAHRFGGKQVSLASKPWWTTDGSHVLTAHGSSVKLFRASDLTRVWRVYPSGQVLDAFVPDATTAIAAVSPFVETGVQIYDLVADKPVALLAEHTEGLVCAAFSPRGDFLATMSTDLTVRIWRCRDWQCVATVPRTEVGLRGGLSFHPTEPLLAMKDGNHVDVVRLDYDVLNTVGAAKTARQYVNAKIVLVGDTGVGKSGLGLVLSGQPFAPTDSTHGRNIWTFEKSYVTTSTGDVQTRETLLWDLAGQPGYRMVHQLHLNEVAVALIVFDARSETDPFTGVQYWGRALAQARRLDELAAGRLRVYLVAARADRGTAAVSQERIEATVKALGFDGYVETSAKEGWGVDELVRQVRDGIDWSALPVVSSNALFEAIKDFVLEEKQQGGILSTVDDLARSFARTQDEVPDDLVERFAVCIGRLESVGVVRRMAYGGFVLLRPELLDAYASSLVEAAKNEPDGLGFVREDDALEGRFRISERLTNQHQERVLLNAVVQELLRREIALKEITDKEVDLIFPSQFTRERPDAPHVPGQDVVFTFDGNLYSIYSTLAVRLSHSRLFQRGPMWHNSASYQAEAGGECGIAIRELEEGKGELVLYYDDEAQPIVRRQFEAYVVEHLHQRAVNNTVQQRRVRRCKPCDYVVDEVIVRRKAHLGHTAMKCPICETTVISLVDHETADVRPVVVEMNTNADAQRDQDVAAVKLKGKRDEGAYDVFLCHNVKDKQQVVEIARRLEARGILPWLDVDAIQPGTRWQQEMAKGIEKSQTAAVLLGPSGHGPWHQAEMELVNDWSVRTGKKVIPVILTGTNGDLEVLQGFTKVWSTVDMRMPDPDPFEQLVWGITGEHPRRA